MLCSFTYSCYQTSYQKTDMRLSLIQLNSFLFISLIFLQGKCKKFSHEKFLLLVHPSPSFFLFSSTDLWGCGWFRCLQGGIGGSLSGLRLKHFGLEVWGHFELKSWILKQVHAMIAVTLKGVWLLSNFNTFKFFKKFLKKSGRMHEGP